MSGLSFDMFTANVVAETEDSPSLKKLLIGYFFEVPNAVDDQWGPEGSMNGATIGCLLQLLDCRVLSLSLALI